jgi:hypothetical protein
MVNQISHWNGFVITDTHLKRIDADGYSASAMVVKVGTANRRTAAAVLWLFANEQAFKPV